MIIYSILLAPFLLVSVGTVLAPFISNGWPVALLRFVELSASLANGIWVAGIAIGIMLAIGLPVWLTLILSWPVLFFSGRFFARLSDEWEEERRRIVIDAQKRREQANGSVRD